MAIEPGRNLLHYRIVDKLGEGGMGVVWRALDTRLDREVAIKVLPAEVAGDPDRLARFEREARTLASLHHPHVASIFGLEEADGVRFLVMELVEGEDLDARLARGPIPVDEAIEIARQIAEGLEAAHERGIVHRDLKPANVKLAPDGTAKVLDFGLAKALDDTGANSSADVSRSPTLTAAATRAGVILGTAAYMSPEQARGKPVDRRTDIWAFGVVLYEMLVGERLFVGETATDIITAVMTREPDRERLPMETPRAVRDLLGRCLTRDPRSRLQSIGEARIALERAGDGGIEAPAVTASAIRSRHFHPAAWVVGIVLAVVLGVVAGRTLRPDPPLPTLRKLALRIDGLDTESSFGFALSPDGRRLAYAARGVLWIRDLDQLEARELPGTAGAGHPFWSPDGDHLGYVIDQKLWRVAADGTGATGVADLPDVFSAAGRAAWTEDGRIVYTTGFTGLLQVPVAGGDVTPLLGVDEGEVDFHDASALPDGRGTLYTLHRSAEGIDTIEAFDEIARSVVLRLEGQRVVAPVYDVSGHVLYERRYRNAGVWAVPYSLDTMQATGEPFLVAAAGARPSVSNDGTLVYMLGTDDRRQKRLVWLDREGAIDQIVQSEPLPFQLPSPCLSPDGRRAGIATREDGKTDFWTVDLETGARSRVTTGNVAFLWFCAFSADGRDLLYSTGNLPTEIAVMATPAEGGADARELFRGSEPAFSPDGTAIAYVDRLEEWDIRVRFPADGRDELFSGADESREAAPAFSPDGKYLAYVSAVSGREEVHVRSFPDGDDRRRVSLSGGAIPRWSPRGDELFFLQGDDMMVVAVDTRGELTIGQPRRLFTREPVRTDRPMDLPDGYAVSPDGKRFLVLEDVSGDQTTLELVLVENWFDEFRDRGAP